MKKNINKFSLAILCSVFTVNIASAQILPGWNVIGQLETRHSQNIKSSGWSIGGETLDRDYADYQSYSKYLGPLGAKKIRLQGGWFKCEKVIGQYDFKWMDDIVNDAHSQGVSPWIELAYGNPIYEGGGEPTLGGALPSSPEALVAWDKWVSEMVHRYKDKVNEWEVWNEPNHGKGITGESYALFYIRTAKLIRNIQPEAKILAVALSNLTSLKFVKEFYETLKRENSFDLVDIFVYHGYAAAYGWGYNPDDVYPQVEVLRNLVWTFDPKVVFMQGESGAPSTPRPKSGVFSDNSWSELSQSKWDLRRMLGDYGRGINTSLFSISDMHYGWGTENVRINTKGILKTNEDKTIDRPKMAYKAAQHVFSLFDDQIKIDSTAKLETTQINQSFFACKQVGSGLSIITIWQNEYPPYAGYEPKSTTITVKNGNFITPVFVDLISGNIFEIPKSQWKKSGHRYIFTKVPVPDYPVLIVDKNVVLH